MNAMMRADSDATCILVSLTSDANTRYSRLRKCGRISVADGMTWKQFQKVDSDADADAAHSTAQYDPAFVTAAAQMSDSGKGIVVKNEGTLDELLQTVDGIVDDATTYAHDIRRWRNYGWITLVGVATFLAAIYIPELESVRTADVDTVSPPNFKSPPKFRNGP